MVDLRAVREWVAGWARDVFYEKTLFQASSRGAASFNLPPKLNRSGKLDPSFIDYTDSGLLEAVSDQVGTMVTGNTETDITVTYQDSDNTLDFVVNQAFIEQHTNAASSKATPVDADELPLVDSAASNVLKKLTWANLKATMLAAVVAATNTWAALQTFSSGISLGNETLSTYDEGTWSPVLSDASSGGNTATVTTTYGAYVKVGKIVTLSFRFITISTAGMTGANLMFLQGLPFTSQNNANYRAYGQTTTNNVTFSGWVNVQLANNATSCTFTEHTSAGAVGTLTVSDFTSGSSNMQGTLTYIAQA